MHTKLVLVQAAATIMISSKDDSVLMAVHSTRTVNVSLLINAIHIGSSGKIARHHATVEPVFVKVIKRPKRSPRAAYAIRTNVRLIQRTSPSVSVQTASGFVSRLALKVNHVNESILLLMRCDVLKSSSVSVAHMVTRT